MSRQRKLGGKRRKHLDWLRGRRIKASYAMRIHPFWRKHK